MTTTTRRTRVKPSRVSGISAIATKSTLLLVNDCPESPFGIHVPDVFTLEGDVTHDAIKNMSIKFSISCSCCFKKATGSIGLNEIYWEQE